MDRTRRARAVFLAALLLLASAGCFVGPQKLSRQLDDWANQSYVDNPWLVGNVASALALWALIGGARFVDAFLNFYYFWFEDAQPLGDGVGTEFEHTNPTIPNRK